MAGGIRTRRAIPRVMARRVRRVAWVVRIVRMTWVVMMNRWQAVMSGVARVIVRASEVNVVVVPLGLSTVAGS